jgi:polyhydroxyalkanoate synthesis regulator phasin
MTDVNQSVEDEAELVLKELVERTKMASSDAMAVMQSLVKVVRLVQMQGADHAKAIRNLEAEVQNLRGRLEFLE